MPGTAASIDQLTGHNMAPDTVPDPKGQPPASSGKRLLSLLINSPAYPALLVIAAICIWQFVVAKGLVPGVPTRYIGSPTGTWDAFVHLANKGYLGSSLWQEVSASLIRVLLGFAIGAGIAIPFGMAMGMYPSVGKLFGPIFSFLRPIPALAFIPVVIIWFGIGQTGRIFVIATTAFLYAVLGVLGGVQHVPQAYLRAARNYHLSRRRTLLYVVLPAALPEIMVGLRTGMALAWAVVVAAELIAAQHGLGYMIENASTFFEVNVVYVGIAIIGAIGVLIELGFALASKRLLHWVGR
ncbi:MAG: ABC transporter permease [Actinomycetota bacterium]|jgi:NitT/TauT family transport system permease protein|nr:ABC transporter permease [Actinomycetota bacterium]